MAAPYIFIYGPNWSSAPCLVGNSSSEPEDGWDTVTQVWRVYASTRAAAAAAVAGRGTALEGNCFVINVEPQMRGRVEWALGEYEWHVTLTARGMLGSKDSKLHYSTQAQRRVVKNVNIPGGASNVSANVAQCMPVVTVRYLTTSAPDMAQIGTAITPPNNLGVPTNPWSTIADPVIAYPDGWTLDDRDAEELSVAGVYLVTDKYVNYPLASPGG